MLLHSQKKSVSPAPKVVKKTTLEQGIFLQSDVETKFTVIDKIYKGGSVS